MKIPKPDITVDEVFKSCIGNMHKANREMFLPCLPELIDATKSYEENMIKGTPQNVAICSSIKKLSKKDLEKLYTTKLSKTGQPARALYNKIINLAPRGICPYCQHQIVSTLDHYYPKAHYISLVITPTNLVPACADCNKNKLDLVVDKKEDAILNPYYEDSNDVVWLKAKLIQDIDSNFLTMFFSVCPSEACDSTLQKRLEKQFVVLHLNNLYSKHAAEELIAVSKRHIRIYKVSGISGVKESLNESIYENAYRPNSWQSAMYRALNDEWYFKSWLPLKSASIHIT